MPDWQSALNQAPGPTDVWPLVDAADARGEHTFAWRDGAPISVIDFLRDVRHVATELPPISRALNACNDRYLFAVALGACLARDIVTLVPPARTQGVLAQLRGDAPDLVLLVDPDDGEPDGGLPIHRIELGGEARQLHHCPHCRAHSWSHASTRRVRQVGRKHSQSTGAHWCAAPPRSCSGLPQSRRRTSRWSARSRLSTPTASSRRS